MMMLNYKVELYMYIIGSEGGEIRKYREDV